MIQSIQWLNIICKTIIYTTTTITVILVSTACIVYIGPSWIRVGFSKGPLGIRKINKLKPKKHSICSVKNLKTLKEFLKTHAKSYRSCNSTLCKQVPKAFKNNSIQINQIHASTLGFKHFLVILSHERRNYSFLPLSFFISTLRFFTSSCMVGTVDEFYVVSNKSNNEDASAHTKTKRLVAWSSSIVWNKTYRAMWFYQTDSAAESKLFIWYATLRIAIERAILLPNVEYIDLGPSSTKNVVQAKEKYGFNYIDNWYSLCYDESESTTTFEYDDTVLLPPINELL